MMMIHMALFCLQALNSTDLKVDEKNSSQDERVDELNDALDALTQQVADTTSTAHTATQSIASKLDDATADLTGSIETGLQALNQRIDRMEAAQRSDTEISRAQVATETVERASAIEALELKISTEAGRLDSEVVALQSLVPVEVQRLENKIGTEVTGLKHQFDAESERVDRVIEEKTQDLNTRLTNGVGSLTMQLEATDSKFTTRIAGKSRGQSDWYMLVNFTKIALNCTLSRADPHHCLFSRVTEHRDEASKFNGCAR